MVGQCFVIVIFRTGREHCIVLNLETAISLFLSLPMSSNNNNKINDNSNNN